MSSLPEIFSPDGPLAQAIGGYRVRGQQLEMAERIAAINSQAGSIWGFSENALMGATDMVFSCGG